MLEAQGLPQEEAFPARHAAATFLAFIVAGVLPLLPYFVPGTADGRFASAVGVAVAAMFGIGAARAFISNVTWWRGGAEMLGLGAIVTAVAYGAGALIASLVG